MIKTVYDKDSYINIRCVKLDGLTKRLGKVFRL
jgi:hypothetical protein